MLKTSSMHRAAFVLVAAALVATSRTSSGIELAESVTGQAKESTRIAQGGININVYTAQGAKGSGSSDGAPAATPGTPRSPGGGTADGPPPPGNAGPGRSGDGQRPPTGDGRGGGGGRRNHDDIVPAVLLGTAAIIAIGSLLAREKTAGSQPAPNTPPQDEIVDRLLTDGPLFASAFNMSAFAVRGFVRGNWPLLIDFQQHSPGKAQLQISARDLTEVYTYELSEACPPPRRCLIQMRLPPEIFGDQLRPAVIAATATDKQGKQTQAEFDVYALGAGPRAVGSVAIDQVSFGPSMIRVTEQQRALYRFYSHSDFSNTSVEFWKVENGDDGTRHHLVDDRLIDGGIRKNQWIGMNERREWDGTDKGQRVSSGRHKVQVRAWDRVGDWVTAWSNNMVMVEQ